MRVCSRSRVTKIAARAVTILYLLHGEEADSDDSWPTVGRAGAILDNLIASGNAVPMLIVMPAGHVSAEFRLTPGVEHGPRRLQ